MCKLLSHKCRVVVDDPSKPELSSTLPSISQQYDRLFGDGQLTRRSSTASSPSSPQFPPLDAHTTAHDRSIVRRIDMVNRHLAPYPTPHTSPVQRPRKTRGPTGQKQMTPLMLNESDTEKKKGKALRERQARGDLLLLISRFQNLLLKTNPKLPQEAIGSEGRGWKELKVNNVSTAIPDPLFHNKTDILCTGMAYHVQGQAMLQFLVDYLHSKGDNAMGKAVAECMDKRDTVGFDDAFASLYDHAPQLSPKL